jgi:hypothetical protein
MLRKYVFLIAFASVLLMSCVPLWVYDYYRPEAPGGTLEKSTCSGGSGPPRTITFERNEVKLSVEAGETENGVTITVWMIIPKGKEVRLSSPIIRVSIMSSPRVFVGALKPFLYTGESPWKIEEPMVGDSTTYSTIFGPRFSGKYFTMSTSIVMPKADTIRVNLPEVLINGQEVELPQISFRKSKSFEFFEPVNC